VHTVNASRCGCESPWHVPPRRSNGGRPPGLVPDGGGRRRARDVAVRAEVSAQARQRRGRHALMARRKRLEAGARSRGPGTWNPPGREERPLSRARTMDRPGALRPASPSPEQNVILHRQGCAGPSRGSLVRSIPARCPQALSPPAREGEFGVPAGGKWAVPGIGVRVPDVLRLGGPVRHNRIPPPGLAGPQYAAMRCSHFRTNGMYGHGGSSFRLLLVLRQCLTGQLVPLCKRGRRGLRGNRRSCHGAVWKTSTSSAASNSQARTASTSLFSSMLSPPPTRIATRPVTLHLFCDLRADRRAAMCLRP
jgi:hypothetical protein